MRVADAIVEHHRHAPSAAAFMARAFRRSPGLPRDDSLPPLVQRWTALRLEERHREAISHLTGLSDPGALELLVPHVLGFRLTMAMLTHRAYPLPIWNALQIRNTLALDEHIEWGEEHELETRVVAHRILEKGAEIDLASELARGTQRIWHSKVTFFYRGRFGAASPEPAAAQAPELAPQGEAFFEMPRAGGMAMARLTGDYNPIHYWGWYARRLRFATRFLHPQRTVGICLARLPAASPPRPRLDVWIKGPVFYGSRVALRWQPTSSGGRFGLALEGDPRYAIRGELSTAA